MVFIAVWDVQEALVSFMDIALVIIVFSVAQSLFGIGLLVFGTPTLLLLGHPFDETLAALLPASIVVSLLQLRGVQLPERAFLRQFAVWCLLPMAAALVLVLRFSVVVNLSLVVAVALAGFAVVRASARIKARAEHWVSRHTSKWLVLMGLVHGLSNLGGGPLMILAASREKEKEKIRPFVAFCYASFAAIQLAVLAIIDPELFGWHQPAYAAISMMIFLLVGQRFFRWVPVRRFDQLLTVFVSVYAAILGLRGVGMI